MGTFHVQQVCLNGHQITDPYHRSPQFRRKHCSRCGAETIHECPACRTPISGDYHVDGFVGTGKTPVPTHCDGCGKPFPWTTESRPMDKVTLLAELRALAADHQDFTAYAPYSNAHLAWLGKSYALLTRWNPQETMSFKTAESTLPIKLTRNSSAGTLLNVLHHAIADLELDVGSLPPQAFGPGAVYDFMKALRDLLASATTSLLVIDPYMDDQIFDVYLTAVSGGVSCRLLVKRHSPSLKAAGTAFRTQHKMTVEIRTSQLIHDRVIFLDDRSCWVLGQSVKDAAKSMPTYLAPLPSDVIPLKKDVYEQIWSTAKPL